LENICIPDLRVLPVSVVKSRYVVNVSSNRHEFIFFRILPGRIYLTCRLKGVTKLCPKPSIHLKAVFVCIMSKPVNLALTHTIPVNRRRVRLVLHIAHREKSITKFSSETLVKVQHLDKISVDTRISLGTIDTGRA